MKIWFQNRRSKQKKVDGRLMPEKSSEDEDSNKDMSGPNSVGTPSNGATGSDDSSQLQEPCVSVMAPPPTTASTQLPPSLPAVSHSNGALPSIDPSMSLHWGVPSATPGAMLPGMIASNGIGNQLPPPCASLTAANFPPCSLPASFPPNFIPESHEMKAPSYPPLYDSMYYAPAPPYFNAASYYGNPV